MIQLIKKVTVDRNGYIINKSMMDDQIKKMSHLGAATETAQVLKSKKFCHGGRFLFDRFGVKEPGSRIKQIGSAQMMHMLTEARVVRNPCEKIQIVQILDSFMSAIISGKPLTRSRLLRFEDFMDCLGRIASHMFTGVSANKQAELLMLQLDQTTNCLTHNGAILKKKLFQGTEKNEERRVATKPGNVFEEEGKVLKVDKSLVLEEKKSKVLEEDKSKVLEERQGAFLQRVETDIQYRSEKLERLRETQNLHVMRRKKHSDSQVWSRLSNSRNKYFERNKDKFQKMATTNPCSGQQLFKPRRVSMDKQIYTPSISCFDLLYQKALKSRSMLQKTEIEEKLSWFEASCASKMNSKSREYFSSRLRTTLRAALLPLVASDTPLNTLKKIVGAQDTYHDTTLASFLKEFHFNNEEELEIFITMADGDIQSPILRQFIKLFLAHQAHISGVLYPSKQEKQPETLFQPTVCEKSKHIDAERLKRTNSTSSMRADDLLQRVQISEDKKKLYREAAFLIQEKADHCTFTPTINKNYKPIHRTTQPNATSIKDALLKEDVLQKKNVILKNPPQKKKQNLPQMKKENPSQERKDKENWRMSTPKANFKDDIYKLESKTSEYSQDDFELSESSISDDDTTDLLLYVDINLPNGNVRLPIYRHENIHKIATRFAALQGLDSHAEKLLLQRLEGLVEMYR